MLKSLLLIFTATLVLYACKPEEIKYTISGKIKGGEGKYIKYIDMIKPGFTPDSLELDMGGNFILSNSCIEPQDLVFYFNPKQSIRLMVLPNEVVSLSGNKSNLVKTYQVSGSKDSEQLSLLLKRNQQTIETIDTINRYYLKVQLDPHIDTIVDHLRFMSDSIYKAEREYLESYIQKNSSSLASYVALSLKIEEGFNFFNITESDTYFHMVDTAMYNRFDTITIYKMLHAYIIQTQTQKRIAKPKPTLLQLGDSVPDIALPNLMGDTMRLSDLKGKYVLIDFWGSWCKPSRTANKNLRSVYYGYRKYGFDIYQVAIERSKEDWINTVREDKLYWKNQVSELNYMKSQTAKDYRIEGMPANFLINPEGIIVAKDIYDKELWYFMRDSVKPKSSYKAKRTPKPVVVDTTSTKVQ